MKNLTSLKTLICLPHSRTLITQWVTITVLLLTLFTYNAKAQNTPIAWSADNTKLRAISYVDFSWLYYYPNDSINQTSFWQTYGNAFGLGSTQMQLSKQILPDTTKDTIGVASNFYTQYYNGVPIENTEYVLHFKRGILNTSHGQIVENFSTSATPHINKQNAIDAALGYIHAYKYYWQDPALEDTLKVHKHDSTATYYPNPALIFAQIAPDNYTTNNFKLAYFLVIYYEDSMIDSNITYHQLGLYVDANNGNIMNTSILRDECNTTPGTVVTTYQGTQSFDIEKLLFLHSSYRVVDDCRDIEVKDPNTKTYCKTYHTSTSGHAPTILWALEKTQDYFVNDRKRFSYDGKGAIVTAWADVANNGMPNAWNDQYTDELNFTGNMEMLDIIAHEYTHGITRYTAGLGSIGKHSESDALNESFSDIFGTIVERNTLSSWTWIIGDYCTTAHFDHNFWRSLSDPHTSPSLISGLSGQPKAYKETSYWDPIGENHHNDGVQNYVFYQLVNSIGWDHAIEIAWRTLTIYANHNNTYDISGGNSIRGAWLAAAFDLYGKCSNEYTQTVNAWYNVGVGASTPALCVNISGPTSYCVENVATFNSSHSTLVLSATASITLGTTYYWARMPYGFTATLSGNTATITHLPNTEGLYALYVVAKNGSNTSVYRVDFHILSCYDKVDQNNSSINTLTSTVITISPNPTRNNLNITNLESNDIVTIFDIEGNRIKQVKTSIVKGQLQMDVSLLLSGVYYIEVKNNDNIKRFKFVKVNE